MVKVTRPEMYLSNTSLYSNISWIMALHLFFRADYYAFHTKDTDTNKHL
jgi:hypothetical protein